MSEITPALTPGKWEWAGSKEAREALGWAGGEVFTPEDSVDRHGLAALCLHEQPFGFTQDDVLLLREYATVAPRLGPLAAKIAALLPPKVN